MMQVVPRVRVKCSYTSVGSCEAFCKSRGDDGYCTLEEIGVDNGAMDACEPACMNQEDGDESGAES